MMLNGDQCGPGRDRSSLSPNVDRPHASPFTTENAKAPHIPFSLIMSKKPKRHYNALYKKKLTLDLNLSH